MTADRRVNLFYYYLQLVEGQGEDGKLDLSGDGKKIVVEVGQDANGQNCIIVSEGRNYQVVYPGGRIESPKDK